MAAAKPVKNSGRTITLLVDTVVEIVPTQEEQRAANMVLQIPPTAPGRKIAFVSGGDPLDDPTTTTPGSPRLMGPGVWQVVFQGNRIKLMLLNDGSGDPVEVEVFFATGIRTQESYESTTLTV